MPACLSAQVTAADLERVVTARAVCFAVAHGKGELPIELPYWWKERPSTDLPPPHHHQLLAWPMRWWQRLEWKRGPYQASQRVEDGDGLGWGAGEVRFVCMDAPEVSSGASSSGWGARATQVKTSLLESACGHGVLPPPLRDVDAAGAEQGGRARSYRRVLAFAFAESPGGAVVDVGAALVRAGLAVCSVAHPTRTKTLPELLGRRRTRPRAVAAQAVWWRVLRWAYLANQAVAAATGRGLWGSTGGAVRLEDVRPRLARRRAGAGAGAGAAAEEEEEEEEEEGEGVFLTGAWATEWLREG